MSSRLFAALPLGLWQKQFCPNLIIFIVNYSITNQFISNLTMCTPPFRMVSLHHCKFLLNNLFQTVLENLILICRYHAIWIAVCHSTRPLLRNSTCQRWNWHIRYICLHFQVEHEFACVKMNVDIVLYQSRQH